MKGACKKRWKLIEQKMEEFDKNMARVKIKCRKIKKNVYKRIDP